MTRVQRMGGTMELHAIAQFLLYKWSSLTIIKNRIFSVKNEFLVLATTSLGFSCGSAGKASACNAGDLGSISGLGRSREENGYPLQYSCLENSMDRGAWQTTAHGSQRVVHDWGINTITERKTAGKLQNTWTLNNTF